MATLRKFEHGTCCGACVIDGFYSFEYKVKTYLDSEYSQQRSEEMARQFPKHDALMEELRVMLRDSCTTRGQVMVILNQDQKPFFHDDLVGKFGFQLIYHDVANPNHSNNPNSRLYTYIRVQRTFKGDRAGLDTEWAVVPVPADPPPPPPPTSAIPKGAVTWGRPI